jgi:hypothetical protein
MYSSLNKDVQEIGSPFGADSAPAASKGASCAGATDTPAPVQMETGHILQELAGKVKWTHFNLTLMFL